MNIIRTIPLNAAAFMEGPPLSRSEHPDPELKSCQDEQPRGWRGFCDVCVHRIRSIDNSKVSFEPFRTKQPRPAIRAARQEVKMIFAVVVFLPGHCAILRHRNAAYIPNCGTYARPAAASFSR